MVPRGQDNGGISTDDSRLERARLRNACTEFRRDAPVNPFRGRNRKSGQGTARRCIYSVRVSLLRIQTGPHGFNITFPNWLLSSSIFCAAAASESGNLLSITGESLPSETRLMSFIRLAIGALNTVTPSTDRSFSITGPKLNVVRPPPTTPMSRRRPFILSDLRLFSQTDAPIWSKIMSTHLLSVIFFTSSEKSVVL